MTFRRCGGRKLVVGPAETSGWSAPPCRVNTSLVKAITRAFQWREQLESGNHATITEIAAAEKINASYVGRVLRLTLLAPTTIEAILAGEQPAKVNLAMLMQPFPSDWEGQRFEAKSLGRESIYQTFELGAKADMADIQQRRD